MARRARVRRSRERHRHVRERIVRAKFFRICAGRPGSGRKSGSFQKVARSSAGIARTPRYTNNAIPDLPVANPRVPSESESDRRPRRYGCLKFRRSSRGVRERALFRAGGVGPGRGAAVGGPRERGDRGMRRGRPDPGRGAVKHASIAADASAKLDHESGSKRPSLERNRRSCIFIYWALH